MNKQKNPKQQIVKTRLGSSSVVQCFPKMFKALESTPSTTEKNEQTKQNYPKVKTIKVSRRVREDTGNIHHHHPQKRVTCYALTTPATQKPVCYGDSHQQEGGTATVLVHEDPFRTYQPAKFSP